MSRAIRPGRVGNWRVSAERSDLRSSPLDADARPELSVASRPTLCRRCHPAAAPFVGRHDAWFERPPRRRHNRAKRAPGINHDAGRAMASVPLTADLPRRAVVAPTRSWCASSPRSTGRCARPGDPKVPPAPRLRAPLTTATPSTGAWTHGAIAPVLASGVLGGDELRRASSLARRAGGSRPRLPGRVRHERHPFGWTFTRRDLHALLDRLDQCGPAARAPERTSVSRY